MTTLASWAAEPIGPLADLLDGPTHYWEPNGPTQPGVTSLNLALIDGARVVAELLPNFAAERGQRIRYYRAGRPTSAAKLILAIIDQFEYAVTVLDDWLERNAIDRHFEAELVEHRRVLLSTANALRQYPSARRALLDAIEPELPDYQRSSVADFLATLPTGFISREDLRSAAIAYQTRTGQSLGVTRQGTGYRGDRRLFAAIADHLGQACSWSRDATGRTIRGFTL